MNRDVDVLMVSDLRFSGGTSHSIAEEIAAQAGAGWTTGLVHLNGHLVARVTAVNRAVRDQVTAGRARLLVGKQPITAKITLIRHPAVFGRAATQLPPIDTCQVVLVANSTLIAPDGSQEFDPQQVSRLVRDHFGVRPRWAPLSPAIRAQLLPLVGRDALLADDWVNVIDAGRWDADHQPPAGELPIIGRHSRPVAAKWPISADELRSIYPVDGSAEVRVLGGAGPALDVLGAPLPDSWRVWDFASRDPREFLRELDAYVYYTDPRWVEAFGRNVLEAMAAGVPVVLPPRLQPIFTDAAQYAEPTEVQGVVRSLHRDPDLWLRIRDHARDRVRERFGHRVHQARIAALTGLAVNEPTGEAELPIRSTRSVAPAPRPRLLLLSSNGSGMGHLMRLLAYARRATSFDSFVLSLSQAVGAASTFDIPYGYVPSAAALDLPPQLWHPIFTDRVGRVVDELQPSVVVFDGTWPYAGIQQVRERYPDPIWVWSRRGMWKTTRTGEQLANAGWFDEVLEPGDFAGDADVGPTTRESAHRIPPVTVFDPSELYSRSEAREFLGLPAVGRTVLVSLSGGPEGNTEPDTLAGIETVRSLGMDVCVTRSAISQNLRLPNDVHAINATPLALYYHAFDAAIAGAGYNSFHELLRFGVPTLFVPKDGTALDDQDRRARWAADQGWAHVTRKIAPAPAAEALTDLLDRRAEIREKVAAADPGNGAVDAAEFFTALHRRRRG